MQTLLADQENHLVISGSRSLSLSLLLSLHISFFLICVCLTDSLLIQFSFHIVNNIWIQISVILLSGVTGNVLFFPLSICSEIRLLRMYSQCGKHNVLMGCVITIGQA